MPQATAYSRIKNFLENNPDRTDHAAINAELDRVSLSINQLRGNATLLQNDDGALRNAIVTLANLAPDVVTGLTGPQGPQGQTGPAGPTGPQGPQGPRGETGASFAADARDTFANRGLYNLQPRGFSFLAMDTGLLYWKLSNASGDWSAGVQFGRGDTGASGPAGPQGPQGLQGLQGIQGLTGPQGPAGTNGLNGVVTSIDAGLKTASLIGRTSVNVQLQVIGGQLRIVLTTS
jgi:hypothetical protein